MAQTMSENIQGGYILLARKMLESEIMNKPPLYFKLWGWMLLQAKFKDNKNLKRGQFLTSINEMQEAMSYYVGYRKETPTKKQIRGVYESLTNGHMIGTTKVTGGLLITILNYNEYQDPKNYEGHNEQAHEGNSKGTSNKGKNEEERKNVLGKASKNIFIPDNYTIQAEHIKYAKEKGLTEEQARDQFEAFCTWHKANGKKYKDWYAAFQNWIRFGLKKGMIQVNNNRPPETKDEENERVKDLYA